MIKIDLYNSMVKKEGTETEEEAKKAYRSAREKSNDNEEKTVDDKVSSALINRIIAMLQKLEKEIDDVDAKIGDRLRLLDRYVIEYVNVPSDPSSLLCLVLSFIT